MNLTVVSTFYRFVSLSPEQVEAIRRRLLEGATRENARGLVLLGSEGINGTIAGSAQAIGMIKELLLAVPEFSGLFFKDSHARKPPFRRFKIDLRREIVTLKADTSTPTKRNNHLTAAEWQKLIESGDPDLLLVDTRNSYETQLGKFHGAFDPGITKFSDFRNVARSGVIPKDKKVLMYCTGGIRCEKAILEMQRAGYEKVYQLEGGILKYLEEFPCRAFEGECFVFDHRVAVDQQLQPSTRYGLCPHCGNPAEQPAPCAQCGTAQRVCEACRTVPERNTCSKNCAYHFRRAQRRAASAMAGSALAE